MIKVDEGNMRKIIKNALKLCIFISLASLPFITAAQIISMDTFLDSFEKPEYYICLEGKNNLIQSAAKDGDYIIIQKSTHPDFKINDDDNILYIKDKDQLACSRIDHSSCIGSIKRYYITDENNKVSNSPIYEVQIVGKIVKIVDNNLWNSISMKIWDVSIHELNINAMFTN
jgi:SOS-response transcriptional repressor LexA